MWYNLSGPKNCKSTINYLSKSKYFETTFIQTEVTQTTSFNFKSRLKEIHIRDCYYWLKRGGDLQNRKIRLCPMIP